MVLVDQTVRGPALADVVAELRSRMEAARLDRHVLPGQTVAVAVGSRGITGIAAVVTEVVRFLRAELHLEPFIVPAMGSHGGATATGQLAVLASHGITEAACRCPIRSGMDTTEAARTRFGFPLAVDAVAVAADHVVLVNRIKPHTMYTGPVESGLAKMLVVGLGNHVGATAAHQAFTQHGFGRVMSDAVPNLLAAVPVLAGVALVERSDDRLARVEVVAPDRLLEREAELLTDAREWMSRLPFESIDLLLLDEIGKDISGAGLDTNVVGRHPARPDGGAVEARVLAVRSLTAASQGNAIGIGLADLCRSQALDAMDVGVTRTNALTAGDLEAAKLPIDFATDRELVDAALALNGLCPPADARVVWARNTLRIDRVACSVAYRDEIRKRPDLTLASDPFPLPFDDDGNLPRHVWSDPAVVESTP